MKVICTLLPIRNHVQFFLLGINVGFFFFFGLAYSFGSGLKYAAIVSYKSLPFTKEVKKLIHLVLHGIALVLGIVGICAAFKNHNESGIPNLYSLHSWLGLGIICLYAVQVYK